jgi:hypothetical protein
MKTFITILLLAAATTGFGQSKTAIKLPERSTPMALTERGPDEVSVRRAISTFFEGMNKSDTTLVKTTLMPGARLQTVINKDGKVSVRDDDFSKFMTSVGKAKPGSLDERLGQYVVHVDGDLATAFTPYEFWYNGQQSHCGANAFTLVRLEGAWKVQAVIDTRRKCQ